MDAASTPTPAANPASGTTEFWQQMAAKELTCGQRQYTDWKRERDTLRDLIEEVEHDLGQQQADWEHAVSSLALQATRTRLIRLERLLALHPEWRPATTTSAR